MARSPPSPQLYLSRNPRTWYLIAFWKKEGQTGSQTTLLHLLIWEAAHSLLITTLTLGIKNSLQGSEVPALPLLPMVISEERLQDLLQLPGAKTSQSRT